MIGDIRMLARARIGWLAMLVLIAGTPAPAADELTGNLGAGDLQLPDRGKNRPPPIALPGRYPVDSAELVSNGSFTKGVEGWEGAQVGNAIEVSEDHAGRNLLLVKSQVVRAFAQNTFQPGRSYRLGFVASRIEGAQGSVEIRFREPGKKASFRTFMQEVASDKLKEYAVEFVAPVYPRLAELDVDIRRGTMCLASVSVKMRQPIPQVETVKSWSGSFVPEGYALVFNDEFNGAALNRSKWFTRFIFGSETGDHLNDEKECYTDNNTHLEHDGVLRLVAKRGASCSGSGMDYESGMIRSDWTARYGFFEARVRMPSGLGVWPAFWLNSDVAETGRLNWPPEIDIFEFVNNGRDDRVNTIHIAASSNPGEPVGYSYVNRNFVLAHRDYRAPFNFDEGWHTIGTEWTATTLSTYVDGLLVAKQAFKWRYRDGALAGPAHILFNLAIGGAWAGRYGIDGSAFPQALEIDWVRVYQREPTSER